MIFQETKDKGNSIKNTTDLQNQITHNSVFFLNKP